MVPSIFIASEWLRALSSQSRVVGVVLLAVSLSMLVLGTKAYRLYLAGAMAALGWFGGFYVGRLMHVTPWYVALPTALFVGLALLPEKRAKKLLPPIIAFIFACSMGTFVTYGLKVANYWMGFGIGLAGAVLLLILGRRFATTLSFAVLGSIGTLVSLGAVVGTDEGYFARGAYIHYPAIYIVVGALLTVCSMSLQVYLDPDVELS